VGGILSLIDNDPARWPILGEEGKDNVTEEKNHEARVRRFAKYYDSQLRKWRGTGDYGLIDPRNNTLIAGEPGQGWTLNDIEDFLPRPRYTPPE